MQVDYLIVGQGIAGTVFCEHVIQSGKTVAVIDEPSMSNSSKVAGGLYNPITGRKMVKTWKCDELFDYLIPFYRNLQERLGEHFLIEKPIYRPFASTEELNEWMGKSAEEIYSPYINKVISKSAYGNHIKDDFGGILLNKSGYLDTALMISSYREFLVSSNSYLAEKFDFAQLNTSTTGISYKGTEAKHIVFCDGRLLDTNPYFKWLPLRPVKGELLFVKTVYDFEVVYNRGVFVVPLSDGICKVGATYDHENLSEQITSEAENELIRRLKQLAVFNFEVVGQKAGIRPATRDRKPFVGTHPTDNRLVVFNGLGYGAKINALLWVVRREIAGKTIPMWIYKGEEH